MDIWFHNTNFHIFTGRSIIGRITYYTYMYYVGCVIRTAVIIL